MEFISEEKMEILMQAQQSELDAVVMYRKLAERMKKPEIAAGLKEIAKDEGRHAVILHELTHVTLTPNNLQANLVAVLMKVLGPKILLPIIAKKEYDAANSYARVVQDFPTLESVRRDEGKHGDKLKELAKIRKGRSV